MLESIYILLICIVWIINMLRMYLATHVVTVYIKHFVHMHNSVFAMAALMQ